MDPALFVCYKYKYRAFASVLQQQIIKAAVSSSLVVPGNGRDRNHNLQTSKPPRASPALLPPHRRFGIDFLGVNRGALL